MLTVAEKGFGKRTPLAEYRITSRGGKGVVNMKTTDRNGSVVATLQVTEESDVMIITHNGKVIRVHANEIREAGRSTQGVRLLRLDDDDSVAAAASILEEEAAVAPPGESSSQRRESDNSMTTKLSYVIEFVADMDRTVKFYRDVVGLPLKFQSPG